MAKAAPLVLLVLLATAARAQPPEAPRVGKVSIEGNRSLSARRILGGLATRPSDRLLFFGEVRTLDLGQVAEDERRIEAFYRSEGFFSARASHRVLPMSGGRVHVQFLVEEGPPAILGSVLIEGMDDLPPDVRRRVLSGNPVREGERWTEEAHLAFKEQLQTRLEEEGYAEASVEARVEVDRERAEVFALYRVFPGERYRFGDVHVVGNLMVPDHRILAAVEPIFEKGDRYSPRRLREAQAEVFDLGVFSTAVVRKGEPDPETGTVPVLVTVQEADFLRFRLGVGAGIEQSYQQLRLVADFAHLDLFRGLQRLEFNNELAYRFIFGGAEAESGIAAVSSLRLTQPAVIGNRIDLAAGLTYERQLTLSFVSQSIRGSLGLPIRFRRWLYLVPSYQIQRYFDVRTFTSPVATGRPLPPVNCPGGCTFSYLEQRLVVDRRSDPLEPRTGFFAALGLQEGGIVLGGDFDWVRIVPEFRTYLPLGTDWVLALRLEAGILQPLQSVEKCEAEAPTPYDVQTRCSPIVVRFFGGGAAGFRGVGATRLSPLQAVVVGRGDDRETVFVPLGGNSSLLATAEFRWYLTRTLGMVLFADVGNVAAGPTEAFRARDVHLAVGTGLRLRTPVGPIRLDLSYRPLRRHIEVVNSDAVLEDDFIDWFSIFISIGEAF
ncbi:MAG: BamA/TamA family outer membrane protein [Pseudomonadota bacterium]